MKSPQNLKVNFAFFGTDELAVKVLETLKAENILPSLIVTTPDKPKGRHLTLTPPPVKLWALENNVEFIQPEKLYNISLSTFELFLVASYGKIIPESVLNLPAHGTLNIHPSLLPAHRGPTPLQSAILNGDRDTGVTIIKLDKEVDHGPIIIQESFSLADKPDITLPELRDKLATLGAQLFIKILPDWLAGKIEAKEQDHTKATFTKKIEKKDGEIKLTDDPIINYHKYRVYLPWPSTFFFDQNGKRIIIKKARLENDQFIIERVIPEGEKEQDWK